jgi:sugar phosphate isomerase/epimerase
VPSADVAELAGLASRHGFATVTVAPATYAAALAAGWSGTGLRALLADRGVAVGYVDAVTSGLPGQSSERSIERYLTSYDDCLRVAEALRAPAINLAHYLGRPVAEPALTQAIGELALAARRDGLRLTVEFIPGTGIPDLATARRVLAPLAEMRVGVLFDTWHHFRSVASSDLEELSFADNGAVQLSDMPPERVGSWRAADPVAEAANRRYAPMTGRLLPGAGCLPLADLVARLRAERSDLALGVEVFSAELRERPNEQVVARAAAAMRRLCRGTCP